jgi:hypothetical protein
VRLRPATPTSIGTTAFFRNRALLTVLCDRLAELHSKQISVLIHACSIGAEIWSLLISARLHPALRERDLVVYASDLEPDFVAYAERAVYPSAILEGMRPAEQVFFSRVSADYVQVDRAMVPPVQFLPAGSIKSFATEQVFDLVMLLNALLYMPGDAQSQVIDSIAQYNRHYLVTTGFHFDRIKSDMTRNGYRPVGDAAMAIHDGWLDRRRDGPSVDEVIPGKIFHPWSLPPYRAVEDHEYKYCAIFAKR